MRSLYQIACGCAIVLLLISALAFAEQVTLSWTDDENNPADVAGYMIYYGTLSRGTASRPTRHTDTSRFTGSDPAPYTNQLEIRPGADHQGTVVGLLPGETYYFSATAFGHQGQETGFSNEASAIIPIDDLKAPKDLAVRAIRTDDGSVIIQMQGTQ